MIFREEKKALDILQHLQKEGK